MSKPLVLMLFLLSALPVLSQASDYEKELRAGLSILESPRFDDENLEDAIAHLERAVTLNPSAVSGHLALADAYRSRYHETFETDNEEYAAANHRFALRAIDEYKAAVALDPKNTKALNNIGQIYRRMAKWNDAEPYFRESLRTDSNGTEALYSLAVVDWQKSYEARMVKRAELKMRIGTPLINTSSCPSLRSLNLVRVEEGIELLKRASQHSKLVEVPIWLSLLHRERADIQCGNRAAYKSDLQSVNAWLNRACEALRSHAARVPPGWPPGPPPPPDGSFCGGLQ